MDDEPLSRLHIATDRGSFISYGDHLSAIYLMIYKAMLSFPQLHCDKRKLKICCFFQSFSSLFFNCVGSKNHQSIWGCWILLKGHDNDFGQILFFTML